MSTTTSQPSAGSSRVVPRANVRRAFATIEEAAEHLHCSTRSIRNYIARGLFPAYRIPGTRGIRIDLAEVDRSMKLVPVTVARPGRPQYGAKAQIIDVPVQPVRPIVVEDPAGVTP